MWQWPANNKRHRKGALRRTSLHIEKPQPLVAGAKVANRARWGEPIQAECSAGRDGRPKQLLDRVGTSSAYCRAWAQERAQRDAPPGLRKGQARLADRALSKWQPTSRRARHEPVSNRYECVVASPGASDAIGARAKLRASINGEPLDFPLMSCPD